MSLSNFLDVYRFHEKFGLVIGDNGPELLDKKLMQDRINFKYEELQEIVDAYNEGDLEKVADGLIDLVYVAMGTAVMMGLPWDNLWAEVHAANMRKAKGETVDHKAGVIKPEGWEPPKLGPILKNYQREKA